MKLLLTCLFTLMLICTFAQEGQILLQGQILTSNDKPIPDAHIISFNTLKKVISSKDGKFNMWVNNGDSLMISHVVFFRKKVYVDSIGKYPLIRLAVDTVRIQPIVISPDYKDEYELAADNMQFMIFDMRPQVSDNYTEKELVQNLVQNENRVERSAAYSLNIAKFSPSEVISNILKKRKKKKLSKQFKSSKKERKKKQEPN